MRKLFVSAAAVLTLSAPAWAQRNIVTCSSQGNGQQSQGSGQQSCPADTHDGVLLVREQSANLCRQGSTWSYDRRGIQVSGGCSADFAVSNRRGENRQEGGGYGGNGYGGNGAGNNGYGNNGVGNNGYGNNGGTGDRPEGYNNGGNGTPNDGANRGDRRDGDSGGRRVVLPQGTQLAVVINQTVRVTDLNQGDFLPASLAGDLTVQGQVVAPAGTPVQAKVTSSKGSTLDLRLDSFTVGNRMYTLETNAVHGSRDAVSTTDQNNRGGFGGVLSSLATAGEITSGTVFNFRLVSAARPMPVN